MDISLISGLYNQKDTVELITQLVHTKIKFLESKFDDNDQEEDIKMHEKQIISLQKSLYDLRHLNKSNKEELYINCIKNNSHIQ